MNAKTHSIGARTTARPGWLLGALAALSLAFPGTASAEHAGWHGSTARYDVHIGVIPAATAQRDGAHAASHPGAARPRAASRHLTVAVIERASNRRVADAQVRAEILENDLIHRHRTRVKLAVDPAGEAPAYCSVFDLHWNGRYRIQLTIDAPGAAPEQVVFVQEEQGLPI